MKNSKTVLLLLATLASSQTQVSLKSGLVSLDSSFVSAQTDFTLEIFRSNSGPNWQTDQCFELYVGSPYLEPSVYSTFLTSNPPQCVVQTEGVTLECNVRAANSLSIVLTSLSASASGTQSISVKMTNFFTPFSAQLIQTINMRSYSDAQCLNGMKTVSVPGLTIQQATMPISQVKLSSTSDTLGSTVASNALVVSFTPGTTMDPSGEGQIQIGIPMWYEIGSTGQRMYNPTAQNKCTSDCMKITFSALVNAAINIQYEQMLPQCIKGTEIIISCSQFYNPITPEEWSGFSVTIFDNQLVQRTIEQTVDELKFDATQLKPIIMPVSSFTVDPTNSMISTYSTWSLSLQVNIPLQTECYIKIYLPPDLDYRRENMQASGIFIKPNLDPNLFDEDLNIVFRTADGTIPKSSVIFSGCNSGPSLGKTPFGRLDISSIQTQHAIKDSDTFEIQIFKDKALTQLIAVLADGVMLSSSQLTPGLLTNISIEPEDSRVQRIGPLTIKFTTSHLLNSNASLLIRLPSGLTTPQAGSILTVTSPNSSTLANKATVLPGNIIEILNLVAVDETFAAGTQIQIVVGGIANQDSVRDAGDFEITTMNFIDGSFYVVDSTIVAKSFIAMTGRIDAVGDLKVPSPVNSQRSNIYTLTFILEDKLPKAGYIMATLPQELQFSPSTTQSSGSCKTYTCTFANSTTVIFLMQQGLEANEQLTLDIGGIINPRSFQPSGPIVLTTLDTDAESQIDSGYSKVATMSVAGEIEAFSVQQESYVNGELNTYTFSVQAKTPVASGDQLIMTLPAQLGVPIAPLNCTGLQNLVKVDCQVDGQKLTFTFITLNQSTGAFTWQIEGIKNPSSTKTSNSFADITFVNSASFKISQYQGLPQQMTNKFPAQLVTYDISQGSLSPEAITQYQITFTPMNALPQTGSIQLTYPSQISLTQGSLTACIVTTGYQTFKFACVIDNTAKTITIQSIFNGQTQPYSGPITITLEQVKNAINNKPGNGFVIQTYADASQTYIVDKLNDFVLTPLFECEYPCQTCSPQNRKSCLNCWPNFDDPNYLMFFQDGTASCRSFCDPGFTTNGNSKKHCEACDPSCGTCAENGLSGDASKCIDCAADYNFRLSKTQTCLKDCTLGMYQSTNTSCSLCRQPCGGCNGTESTCTECTKTSNLAQLFDTQCIQECPVGYVSVDNVCQKCESPCSTCSGRPDSCESCDGTGGSKFTYQKQCYKDCPAGSAPNSESLICFACLPGCDLCDLKNQTKCLKCTSPTLAFEGECITDCPDGWHSNSDQTACRLWQLQDMGTLPFPFLIAAVIATVMCLFGMMRKRAYLSHGKMATYSPQHTLTCIIVCLAPLQFLATICQWVLSYIYGTTTFCILAALVTLAAIVVNVAFQIMFVNNFDSKKIPVNIDRKVRLGKMTEKEAKKYLEPRDQKFNLFKRQNRCTTYTVFTLSAGLNYKFNKLFYSFFYDLKEFQAHFSRAKYYRKMQTWYSIVYLICIDLALICIDVTALTQIEQGNQLFITLIETLVLSVLSIVLGSIELWLLKRTMKYTETLKDKSQLKLGSGLRSSSEDEANLDKKYDKAKMAERRRLMDGLLRQVKHNKQLFLNNKLDELIYAFGDRKCKSMMDLGTGMDLEDDPQERVTYPISPQMRDDYNDMELQFRAEDAYGVQADKNSCSPRLVVDQDVRFMQLKEAMRRQQDTVLQQSQQDGDLEELRHRRQTRKRGRKNKFHAQIDQEDHADLEHIEASDNDDELQIIKEQELEEEDQLRKVKNFKLPTAAEIRKNHLREESLANKQKDLQKAEARNYKNTLDVIQQDHAAEQKKRDSDMKFKQQEQARQQAKIKEEQEKVRQAILKKKLMVKVDAPPQADLRSFNENDILGDLDRDEKGNVVVPEVAMDKQGKTVNARGYLVDESGNIIDNLGKNMMFAISDLDETGEITQPFSLERFNFNAHFVMGDFEFKNKKPYVIASTQKGQFVDRRGRRCTKQGWLISQEGHLIDINNRKKLDSAQLTTAGDLHKLYNFAGKKFDIKDVMGIFERDQNQRIVTQTGKKGGLIDSQGRSVNENGYLLDRQGNIVDVKGNVIWKAKDLKNGEFIKIFPFSKFNLKRVKVDSEVDQSSGPSDTQSRQVNKKGYTVDSKGNVIDSAGCVVFEKEMLDSEGQIPSVFRSKILKQETGSDLSKLMEEIELNNNDEEPEATAAAAIREGETSMDSQMGDTPANYNQINQRVESQDHYQDVIVEEGTNEGKQKSSRKKLVMVLQPSAREKNMAGAYGGQAVGSIRRPGIKYEKERLKDGMKFRVSAEEEPHLRAQLNKLVKSGSRIEGMQPSISSGSKRGSMPHETLSQRSQGRQQPYSERKLKAHKKQMKDGEFEELFGKDLDQFLEDSEWDMKSIDKVSDQDKEYVDDQMLPQNKKLSPGRYTNQLVKQQALRQQEKGPDRETILSFSDDPGVIYRGEILPFNTNNKVV